MDSSGKSNQGGFWSEVNSDIDSMKTASQNDSMQQNNTYVAANHQESHKEAMANISSLNTAWKDKVHPLLATIPFDPIGGNAMCRLVAIRIEIVFNTGF